MTEYNLQIKPYPLGAHCEAEYIRFSFASDKEQCGIIIYDRRTNKKLKSLSFLPTERMGNVYCKYVSGLKPESISYQFCQGDKLIPDEQARGFVKQKAYGRARQDKELRAIIPTEIFDWEKDVRLQIPYSQCICYCMHVRGFTRHFSSGVAHPGTFLGIVEKSDYLKELGITTIELQPAYEFLELKTRQQDAAEEVVYIRAEDAADSEGRLNYWGYCKGYYYTPKAGYAAGDEPSAEFKTMVRELHKKGIEVIMQFYFPLAMDKSRIAEILRFWVIEYHVDGFHLIGENIPCEMIAADPALADTKIWGQTAGKAGNLAEYHEDYMYTMRRFLKGDEGMLNSVLYQLRHIPKNAGRIHYMSNYNTFTLLDMVSYDEKHNQDNGEENMDGSSYNCSWNCGEEGNTRKKKVLLLRRRQLKNAMCMLLLTQSAPLIFMGDEFGNSQQGNNNPYCQDNKTAWLDWRELEKNKELTVFFKQLVQLRLAHRLLHPAEEMKIMDYMHCGYPDLSYHGQNAWNPRLEGCDRHIGIMYCGRYAKNEDGSEDDFIYVAMNMHWEVHQLALPKLPKELKWSVVLTTEEDSGQTAFLLTESTCQLGARSIAVLKSTKKSTADRGDAADE